MAVPDERAAELATAITSRATRTGNATQKFMDSIDASLAELDRRVTVSITNPRKNEVSVATSASEIRQYVANMPKKDRMSFLHDRIEKGDHQVVTAVLDGSCWVSGLNDEEFDIVRSLAQERFAPRDTAQAAALRKCRAQVETGAYEFSNVIVRNLPRVKEDRKEAALRQLKTGG